MSAPRTPKRDIQWADVPSPSPPTFPYLAPESSLDSDFFEPQFRELVG